MSQGRGDGAEGETTTGWLYRLQLTDMKHQLWHSRGGGGGGRGGKGEGEVGGRRKGGGLRVKTTTGWLYRLQRLT